MDWISAGGTAYKDVASLVRYMINKELWDIEYIEVIMELANE